MPSYVIHVAIGQEYIKKHPGNIQNKEQFIQGVIAPDRDENKQKAHFCITDRTNIQLCDYIKTHSILSDYEKGYYLHLLTDYLFYSVMFKEENKTAQKEGVGLYSDYDVLTKPLILKYQVELPKEIEQYSRFVEGKLTYLAFDKISEFIDLVSSFQIEEEIENRLSKKERRQA